MTPVTCARTCVHLLCATIAVCLCLGCESSVNQRWTPPTAAPKNTPSDPFASGADREPSAKTIYALADLMVTQGKDQRAEMALKHAIKKDPNYYPAYSKLAALQMRNQRHDDAISTLQAGLEQSPDQPILLNNLGMCYLTGGRRKKALKYFTRATGLKPENARYRGNMAVALGLMGRYEESLSLFLQILSPLDAHRNISILAKARQDDDRYTREILDIYRIQQGQKGKN